MTDLHHPTPDSAPEPPARRPAVEIAGPSSGAERPEGSLIDFDVMSPRCPSRTVLRHVVDRWTPLVVTALEEGPLRFTEIRRRVGGVTPKVLTQTLRSMERDGLVTRSQAGGVPPRVDYDLTPLGLSLRAPVAALRQWAQQHAEQVLGAREAYDTARPAVGQAAEPHLQLPVGAPAD